LREDNGGFSCYFNLDDNLRKKRENKMKKDEERGRKWTMTGFGI